MNPSRLKVSIEGDEIVVRIPLFHQPRLSIPSKRTMVIASTGGFLVSTGTHEGKRISVMLSAVVPIVDAAAAK